MDKKYTLDGETFTVLTVTKPGLFSVLGYSLAGLAREFTADGLNPFCSLVEVSPYPDFKIDEPVMVRDESGNEWDKKCFSGVSKNGLATCWLHGGTSWTTNHVVEWRQCRRPTAEELAT